MAGVALNTAVMLKRIQQFRPGKKCVLKEVYKVQNILKVVSKTAWAIEVNNHSFFFSCFPLPDDPKFF